MLTFRNKIFAHRGLHGDHSIAPENSMEAFRRAVDAGLGIELDVQFSRDRKVVVFHDDSLLRVCGTAGLVRDYDYAELQQFPLHNSDQRIPLFADVLNLVAGRVPLIVEIKAVCNEYDPQLAEATARILDRYPGEYAVESFHPAYVLWFRVHRPAIRRGQLSTEFFRVHTRGLRWEFWLLESMATNLLTRPDFIAYDIRFHNHLPFRFWKHFCTPVGWTLRDPALVPALSGDFDYFIAERVKSSD